MIIIADDEVMIAYFVADVLRDEGYEVRCVHDGETALLAIQVQAPDVVILDNMMPQMTGAEVTRALRTHGFQQPIIIMSATGLPQTFLDDGADGFLAKPFSLAALIQAVAQQLSRS